MNVHSWERDQQHLSGSNRTHGPLSVARDLCSITRIASNLRVTMPLAQCSLLGGSEPGGLSKASSINLQRSAKTN